MSRSTLPLFPTDEGWPYPDSSTSPDQVDDADIDLDALELRVDPHAFDTLSDLERSALFHRFGLRGETCLSMKQLGPALGCTRSEARRLVGTAIDKVRTRLTAP
ncbi:MAG: hypothetical protein M5T61_13190 [Acidimicrobiia bacterium]|nr:hypothetical protein [Acidimicrobiia bacterium]